MRRSILSGAVVAGLLAFGVGGWAATAELAGAVIAPGLLVVESNVKKVQHPTGGWWASCACAMVIRSRPAMSSPAG